MNEAEQELSALLRQHNMLKSNSSQSDSYPSIITSIFSNWNSLLGSAPNQNSSKLNRDLIAQSSNDPAQQNTQMSWITTFFGILLLCYIYLGLTYLINNYLMRKQQQ